MLFGCPIFCNEIVVYRATVHLHLQRQKNPWRFKHVTTALQQNCCGGAAFCLCFEILF
ncbi:hypothetical protein IGI04_007437 [Brassica rapa subsp. trilocularis]|uniref:Uncharacterized protein n=1 Tax=Brassica rapa subsp. trilocularis TaxID=1813537 RepID=A0ABQ7NK19_BRACM|nr:hypothetical protein IGI04_007437 [Brassica rapa subsp. trilocularis]